MAPEAAARRIPAAEAESLLRERDFEAFVAHHRDRAVALAWRLCGGDAAAAEDVAQEAFVRAHRALGGFRSEAALSTWFTRILVNEARRHRRWCWVRERFSGPLGEEPPAPAAAPDDFLLRERIARALARLSHAQREAFVLVHLEGFAVREAADLLGRAPGTIKAHLHRARLALRARLADLASERGPAPARERTE